MGQITESLSEQHDLSQFDCGQPVLNDWLKRLAYKNQLLGASRTFVICPPGSNRVVGYYALAAGGVDHLTAPRALRRNMPDPIPVTLLGRLAVDQVYHGQNIGTTLLRDALAKTLAVAQHVGTAGLLVHCLNDDARRFYQRLNFIPSPVTDMTLMLPIKSIQQFLRDTTDND